MQKKPLLKNGEEGEVVNEYYLKISKKLRATKYLLLLFMVASLIFTLWAYRTRLTYSNFRYLLRDIDEAGHTTIGSDSVYFGANDTNTFLYFRGDLAVGSSEGVSFHRALGSRSFEDNVVFKSPVLCGSDKYMIAYDAGGKTFYVYNSISRVYSETLTHAIIDCAAAANGDFAVLTKSDVGDFLIKIYDKNFNLTGEVTRQGFVYSLDFIENGKLSFAECYVNNAAIYTDVIFYTLGSESPEKFITSEGLLLDSVKTKNGIMTLFDGGIDIYSESGEKAFTTSFGTADIIYGDKNDNGMCVLLDTNKIGEGVRAVAAFSDGTSFSAKTDAGAKGIAICKDKVCVLYDGYLLVCGADNVEKIEIPDKATAVLTRDNTSVIVCFSDYAKVYEV